MYSLPCLLIVVVGTSNERGRVYVNVSALKIHPSESARDALAAFPQFITERRGDIFVKVKNSYSYLYHIIRGNRYLPDLRFLLCRGPVSSSPINFKLPT